MGFIMVKRIKAAQEPLRALGFVRVYSWIERKLQSPYDRIIETSYLRKEGGELSSHVRHDLTIRLASHDMG